MKRRSSRSIERPTSRTAPSPSTHWRRRRPSEIRVASHELRGADDRGRRSGDQRAGYACRSEMKRRRTAREINRTVLRQWPLPAAEGSDSKEDRGRVLVVGGSTQVPGGVLLAATAALRAGAGKLQIATATDAALPLAIAMPEALVMPLACNARGDIVRASAQLRSEAAHAQAIAIGSGMPATRASSRIAKALLEVATGSVLLDAGALGACAPGARRRASPVIITPHRGQKWRKLTGEDEDVVRRVPRNHRARVRRPGTTSSWCSRARPRSSRIRMGAVGTTRRGCRAGYVRFRRCPGRHHRRACHAARRRPEQAAAWGVGCMHRPVRGCRNGWAARVPRTEIAGEIPSMLDAFPSHVAGPGAWGHHGDLPAERRSGRRRHRSNWSSTSAARISAASKSGVLPYPRPDGRAIRVLRPHGAGRFRTRHSHATSTYVHIRNRAVDADLPVRRRDHASRQRGPDQLIRPGEVNWMTAGRGITHSERFESRGPTAAR